MGEDGRARVPAAGPWASRWGYSRAVRAGDHIEVSGTVGIDAAGNVVAPGDAYTQARTALQIILTALADLGATPADVIRTRAFLRNIDDWQSVGRAHAEIFADIQPASSCLAGIDLIDPNALVEIEATAILRSP